jgi:hypothetical protein
MYWRSGQYGILKRHPPDERLAIVQAAVRKYGRGYSRRFLLAVALLLGLVITSVRRIAPRSLSDWRVWGVAVIGGTLFYLYLLWEINGPVRVAVERYVAEGKSSGGAERKKKPRGRWRRKTP